MIHFTHDTTAKHEVSDQPEKPETCPT